MYTRKTLCLLAGLDLEAFKHAAKNDDLPILPEDDVVDRAADRGNVGYARYTPKDVLAVACAVQLANGGGYLSRAMPFAEASKVIRNAGAFMLLETVQRAKSEHRAIFLGYAAMNGEDGTAGMNVSGTWSEIGEKALIKEEASEITSLYLVAPLQIERMIAKRAEENDIGWAI